MHLRVNKFRRNSPRSLSDEQRNLENVLSHIPSQGNNVPGCQVRDQLQRIQSKISERPSQVSGVYVIHSKVNDFIYVGSALRSFSLRWEEHLFDLRMMHHSNSFLQFLYCKYGIDNLDFYMIEVCSPKDCLKRESYHVQDLMPELNLNALLGTSGFDSKLSKEWDEWYETEEGREYKRNTIDIKRAEWVKTPVGRNCVRQDIKNLKDRLNKTNLTQDEKVTEILGYFREYFPTMPIKKETLIQFMNEGTPFEPIWSSKSTKPINKDTTIKPIKVNKSMSQTQIRRMLNEKIKSGVNYFFIVLFLLAFLFLWWLMS